MSAKNPYGKSRVRKNRRVGKQITNPQFLKFEELVVEAKRRRAVVKDPWIRSNGVKPAKKDVLSLSPKNNRRRRAQRADATLGAREAWLE